MKIVYSDKHAAHDPQTFFVRGVKQRSAEQPERATRLLAAAQEAQHKVVAPRSYGAEPAATVHTPEYIDFLQTIAQETDTDRRTAAFFVEVITEIASA